jgi:cell division inhibitor SulA
MRQKIIKIKKSEKNTKDESNMDFTNPISQLFNTGNANQQQSIIDAQKLTREWLSKKHLNMKTNLNQNQINSICILMTMAKQFKIMPLKNLILNFIMYMISKESQSAKQLVDILQSRGLLDTSEAEIFSKFTK